jgi:hypothetical protein
VDASINVKFLERWPTGRGSGWIAQSNYPDWDTFHIVKVTTANTSGLDNGSAECRPEHDKFFDLNPRFMSIDKIFYTEAGAVDYVNTQIKSRMEGKLGMIRRLQEEVLILKGKLI